MYLPLRLYLNCFIFMLATRLQICMLLEFERVCFLLLLTLVLEILLKILIMACEQTRVQGVQKKKTHRNNIRTYTPNDIAAG